MPLKHGPHGELLFCLVQKEPAIVPDSETFNPFFNAEIRTPLFPADFLKKCALIALHLIAGEGRDGDGCHAPGLGDKGKWAAQRQRAQCGRAKAKLGREDEKVCLLVALGKATWVTRRFTSSGCVGPGGKISLVLQDWEQAKVALSCRMVLDMLCQENGRVVS